MAKYEKWTLNEYWLKFKDDTEKFVAINQTIGKI